LEDKVKLTHIDEMNNPAMVDITEKSISKRVAVAEGFITLPPEIFANILNGDISSKKGPVIQTSIIAGTMAVKKTSELIPFCHPLMIEKCSFKHGFLTESYQLKMSCEVHTTGKTGVEMEALTGVQVALLTVYDMLKAISHQMTIGPVSLVKKTGGKSDFKLRGLVLCGGQSSRMGQDKSAMVHFLKPQAEHLADLLSTQCDEVYYSLRADQTQASHLQNYPHIIDTQLTGPGSGIIEAFNRYPNSHWLVVACDMPYVTELSLQELIQNYQTQKVATCFKNPENNLPEPLLAIYSPNSVAQLKSYLSQGKSCMRKFLITHDTKLVEASNSTVVTNWNSPNDIQRIQS